MKNFYKSERITFFTMHPNYVEIRTHHSIFWGLYKWTTVKDCRNQIA